MKLYEYLSSLGIEDWLLQLKYARSIRIIFNVCFWPESVGPTTGRPTERYIPLVPVLAVSSRYQHQNYMVLLIMLSIFIRRGHGLNCQHWFNSESSRVKGLNLVRGTWRAVWFSRSFCREKWHIISHPKWGEKSTQLQWTRIRPQRKQREDTSAHAILWRKVWIVTLKKDVTNVRLKETTTTTTTGTNSRTNSRTTEPGRPSGNRINEVLFHLQHLWDWYGMWQVSCWSCASDARDSGRGQVLNPWKLPMTGWKNQPWMKIFFSY